MSRRFTALVFLALTATAAASPISSYDAFWHLAAGRWIARHQALPLTDPFAVASARVPWIDGEWLYQLFAYGVQWLAGYAGLALAHALLAGAIFTLAFVFASRDCDPAVAAFVSALAFAGASDRLGVRPASFAALFVVLAIAILASRMTLTRMSIVYALLTIVWINVHPSGLLAPVLAAATLLITPRRIVVVLASACALFVNPYGYHAITAPLELAALVRSGAFINAEWLPSPIVVFPLLYLCVLAGIALFAWRRQQLWRFAIFVLLAFLAIRYVRNQSLFFAAMPILLGPLSPRRGERGRGQGLLYALALLPILFVFIRTPHHLAIDETRFPVHSAERLKATHLPGNIYNADQFGGYLIWMFDGERRVLTDGRNELYQAYIAEDTTAHADSRAWSALVRKYRVDLAVDEISPGTIKVMDMQTRAVKEMPAWMARYPRRTWALIGRDAVSLVFARRAAFPPEVLRRWELVD